MVGSTGVLLGAGVGSAAAKGKPEDKPERKGASAEKTIFDIVEESDDFDTLEFALESTSLSAVLDSNDAQYTVLAPTDDAFDKLNSIPSGSALANVLKYHVTNGRRYSESLVNPPEVELEMLNGGVVTISGTDVNGDQADIVTGTAERTIDIEASNGVVHVIDGVLLP